MGKSSETRTKLLETAVNLIWQSNYKAVGVAEICKQAGVTKGSFYHHFESKADLFVAASEHSWEQFRSEFDIIYSPRFGPLEQLENLIQLVLEQRGCENASDGNPVAGCPFFTSGSQAGCGEEKVRNVTLEMTNRANRYNAALVRNLKGAGMLEGDVDPDQTGRMIHHYVLGLLMYGRVRYSIQAVKDDLRDGIYRLICLKPEYRRTQAEIDAAAQAEEPVALS